MVVKALLTNSCYYSLFFSVVNHSRESCSKHDNRQQTKSYMTNEICFFIFIFISIKIIKRKKLLQFKILKRDFIFYLDETVSVLLKL